jgi:acid stress chaperone HdeB
MGKIAYFSAILTFMGSAAQAQTTIDVSKVTCEQYIAFKVADPEHIALWLSGYYSGVQKDTIVEVQQLKDSTRKLSSFCLYNKKMSIMDAVEKALK